MDPAIIFLTLAYLAAAVVFIALLARTPRPTYRVTIVPEVTTDGPLQPEDLLAIGVLLTAHCPYPEAVYAQILDQVAKDEAAAGLDAALDRITGDGAR